MYRHIDAIQEALRIYDMPVKQVRQFFPSYILEFKDLCKDIFTSETPYDLIEEHKKLLHIITGTNGEFSESVLGNSNNDLFLWDDGSNMISDNDEIGIDLELQDL